MARSGDHDMLMSKGSVRALHLGRTPAEASIGPLAVLRHGVPKFKGPLNCYQMHR
jgi:hypothetical protein